ncbi:bifunctional phosphopantothenoylcysteine decarboxylase/phosphopantothenate--cysteine ligase CoaBC [Candidatus Poribacteria bacterium]|nr:bifunctional phosphopantothenoylcysteine decarboxylase/phosphopantothenate--cysteine ligase CoaBC [Candidatus Poribacteria bacterium]
MPLEGVNILYGVTGSIAAYKAAELTSLLRKAGADVHVVMTPNASRFIAPLTLATLSRNPVHTDTFDISGWKPEHTTLADAAQLLVVAPATANAIAKFACGIADDLLSTLFLAARCPTLIAPAMNSAMYDHPAVVRNIRTLTERGAVFSGPDYGMLADGYEGRGRLRDVPELFREIEELWNQTAESTARDLAGRRVVVTAGPTREYLDPVRFISNRSSGKMGYALAEAAEKRGADVTLVSGPAHLDAPARVRRIDVGTAAEMLQAARQAAENADIVIFAAAVADYTPETVSDAKIKKSDDALTLRLVQTTDISADIGGEKGNRVLVGFAAETNDGIANATRKLREKNLDLIVLNDVTQPGAGFDADTNIVTFIDGESEPKSLPMLPKSQVAHRILDAVARLLEARR